ncbi:MAG: hypothetical protein RIB93_01240 [Coleofasciculus sp. D1-CHI-01]|uniref:hypothetical protein n=1 Tax=Coleofasciculus sp. D1-CHI-01 TaxID=3068482 RepID=UPI0032F78DDE
MQAKDSPQHFLDTSVVRSMLLGTQAYRQYFNSNLAERPLYISNYIQMEMKRSYLEHTDNSFDYLCPPIEQHHNKHPSEKQVLTDSSG